MARAGRTISANSIVRTIWETASGSRGYPDSAAVAKTLLSRVRRSSSDAVDGFFVEAGTGRATLFGVMGYARIDLSVVTRIMADLTIGVGIDYAIHYVSPLQQARRRGEKRPSESVLRYVATPVLANALGLAVGFTAMLFSPLQIHVTLSTLMWVTMVTSAVLSLTFLPTITGGRFTKDRLLPGASAARSAFAGGT